MNVKAGVHHGGFSSFLPLLHDGIIKIQEPNTMKKTALFFINLGFLLICLFATDSSSSLSMLMPAG